MGVQVLARIQLNFTIVAGMVVCLSSQVTCMSVEAPLSWAWLKICMLRGSSEWICYFTLLVWVAFALPVKLSLSQLMSFCSFTLPLLSSILLEGREWAVM